MQRSNRPTNTQTTTTAPATVTDSSTRMLTASVPVGLSTRLQRRRRKFIWEKVAHMGAAHTGTPMHLTLPGAIPLSRLAIKMD